jgi:hypothetical protein
MLIYSPAPPKRTARYLRQHLSAELPKFDARWLHAPPGMARLAWHDLAANLNAVVLPLELPCLGNCRPLVPLNTVYYIDANIADAHLLAAYFNSLPFRVFARALAERAKDAHFRFFAGTIAQLPLPQCWQHKHAAELRALSQRAHEQRGWSEHEQQQLDELSADSYGLVPAALNALRRFDHWLAGRKA